MDQVKLAGTWLKKNYFWVLAGTCAILSIAFWFISTGALSAQASTWTGQIDSAYQTGQSVVSTSNHPNDVSHKKMDERIAVLADDVYAAWAARYNKQKRYLIWQDFAGDEFVATVRKLQPIELHVEPTTELLDVNERQIYRNFIDDELANLLAKTIDAQWYADAAEETGSRVGSGATNEVVGVVDWAVSNQKEIHESRFTWTGRVPTTLEILYAQEDLWVYSAVLSVIQKTNGDITQRYQAAIKTVKYIDIGRDAIGFGGLIGSTSSTTAETSGGSDMMSSMGGPGGSDMMAGGGATSASTGGAGTGGAAATTSDPGDHRYIDTTFKPVMASSLRSAYSSSSPDDAYLIVAKRMPVRMGLVIDHRQLPKLLAECGNADLQLEIRQVRIATESLSDGRTFVGGSGGGGGRSGGGMFGGEGDMDGGGGSGGGMFGRSSTSNAGEDSDGGEGMFSGGGGGGMGGMYGGRGGTTQTKLSDDSPYDVHVELYGVIYIYNPVDREKLGKKLDNAGENVPTTGDDTSDDTSDATKGGAKNAAGDPAARNNGGAVEPPKN